MIGRRAVALLFTLAACGGDDGQSVQIDAAIDSAPVDATSAQACTGACATTSLAAAFQATRTLSRAYFGITDASDTLRIEAYLGGGTGCPTMTSPTPDYALVLSSVARAGSATPSSPTGNILDYVGDLLGGPLGRPATAVTLTPVAQMNTFVAFDANIAFADGTVTGHLYATHCATLDTP